MSKLRFENPIFVAIDTPDLDRALALARAVGPHVGGLKVGLEFITAQGPDGIRAIAALGRPVFADTKFHDIPNTVAGAAREIAKLGVAMFNIHASGGEAMMRAAKEAASSINPDMKLIAVTVLTSIDDGVLETVGQRGPRRGAGRAARDARAGRAASTAWSVPRTRSRPSARPAARTSFWSCRASVRPAATLPTSAA